MLNLKHLYYFHIYAQELSTTRAAKRLNVTVPALSNQLKQLNQFIGLPLSVRKEGKLVITETGEMVKHYVNRMFSAYDELRLRLSLSGQESGNLLKIGICQNLGSRFSFDLMSLMIESNLLHSKNVKVTIAPSHRLLVALEQNKMNFILGAFQGATFIPPSLFSQTIAFPVRLFAPKSMAEGIHEKADLTRMIEFANEKKISLVVPSKRSVLREEIERFLLHSKVMPLKIIECNSSGAIVQLIERGLALGFAPTPCLLDFKSAASLSVWGPLEGCWSHAITALAKRNDWITPTPASPSDKLFSSGPVKVYIR